MRLISFCFSLKIEQNHQEKTIKLSKLVYINKVFIKFYLDKTHLVNILMKEKIFFEQKAKINKKVSLSKK